MKGKRKRRTPQQLAIETRDEQILALALKGKTSVNIAGEVGVSVSTVKRSLRKSFDQLQEDPPVAPDQVVAEHLARNRLLREQLFGIAEDQEQPARDRVHAADVVARIGDSEQRLLTRTGLLGRLVPDDKRPNQVNVVALLGGMREATRMVAFMESVIPAGQQLEDGATLDPGLVQVEQVPVGAAPDGEDEEPEDGPA